MVPRPALQHALLGVGVLCLLAAALVGGGGPTDPDYVHHVSAADGGTLAYGLGYDAGDGARLRLHERPRRRRRGTLPRP